MCLAVYLVENTCRATFIGNGFCPTGKGGGLDNTCGVGGAGGAKGAGGGAAGGAAVAEAPKADAGPAMKWGKPGSMEAYTSLNGMMSSLAFKAGTGMKKDAPAPENALRMERDLRTLGPKKMASLLKLSPQGRTEFGKQSGMNELADFVNKTTSGKHSKTLFMHS